MITHDYTAGRLLTKSIEIADVLELLVGQTSAVFRRNAAEEACRSSAQVIA